MHHFQDLRKLHRENDDSRRGRGGPRKDRNSRDRSCRKETNPMIVWKKKASKPQCE